MSNLNIKSYGGCHDCDTHRLAVRRPEADSEGCPERDGHH